MRDAILLGVGALAGAIATWIVLRLARKPRTSEANTIGRDAIEAALGREIFRARRYERPFAAVLLAIEKGDLGRLEQELRNLIRKTDEVGRWDEHRLLLVLAESNGKEAWLLLDRIAPALKHDVHVAVTDYVADDATRTIMQRLESSLAQAQAEHHAGDLAQQRSAV
jgi:hypothetical protein